MMDNQQRKNIVMIIGLAIVCYLISAYFYYITPFPDVSNEISVQNYKNNMLIGGAIGFAGFIVLLFALYLLAVNSVTSEEIQELIR